MPNPWRDRDAAGSSYNDALKILDRLSNIAQQSQLFLALVCAV